MRDSLQSWRGRPTGRPSSSDPCSTLPQPGRHSLLPFEPVAPALSLEPLPPYQFNLVYRLLREPRLTAGELGCAWPVRERWDAVPTSAQQIAARLLPLRRRGWVEAEMTEAGINVYSPTEKARAALCW